MFEIIYSTLQAITVKKMRTYSEILDFLYGQLPMFQRTGPAAYKDNLDNTVLLDELFNHPHRAFKTIHIAGTNGKGSVSHMLASVFQEAGYKTGLYTSPHLKDFRERIRVDGEMISEEAVVQFTESFIEKDSKIEPSFFELTVSMAFDYFRTMQVDIAIIEVGLGGRLDSTNIITPEVSVITNISFDHKALLGNTLPLIAAEKAGIIKKNIPVIIGETHPETSPVFIETAKRIQTNLSFADQEYHTDHQTIHPDGKQSLCISHNQTVVFSDLKLDLLGIYQRYNVPTVLKTIETLKELGWKIPEEALFRGLANTVKNTGLMGRWQILGNNPLIICDTGHNQAGIQLVVEQLRQTSREQLHIVIGMVNDKDQNEVLALLPKNAQYYFTKADLPRATEPEELASKAIRFGLNGICYPSVRQAFLAACKNAGKNDLVFIGGSTFVVAEIL